jgi:probable HAF family extracellular repeat protein
MLQDKMLQNKISASFFALAMLAATAAAQDQPTYKTVDYPGAIATQPQGINAEGEIVGIYTDAAGRTHGFLLDRGRWTSIDYPGAIRTAATGIDPEGNIVGDYHSGDGEGLVPRNQHGFLLTKGKFTEIQAPGYLGTIAQRITSTGEIYGCTHDVDYGANMRGFRRHADGTWSVMDVPSSMSNGATPDGSFIAGLYMDMMTGLSHGFLLRNGAFESFDVPGSNFTQAWDANVLEQVVGSYRDTAGKFHAFLLSEGRFTTLDYPHAVNTQARGINPQGDIVGFYTDSGGKTHGFLRSSPEE